MKIKLGTVKKDRTAYGNKYWIQVEDNSIWDNCDLESLVGESVTIVIGLKEAINNVLFEQKEGE